MNHIGWLKKGLVLYPDHIIYHSHSIPMLSKMIDWKSILTKYKKLNGDAPHFGNLNQRDFLKWTHITYKSTHFYSCSKLTTSFQDNSLICVFNCSILKWNSKMFRRSKMSFIIKRVKNTIWMSQLLRTNCKWHEDNRYNLAETV